MYRIANVHVHTHAYTHICISQIVSYVSAVQYTKVLWMFWGTTLYNNVIKHLWGYVSICRYEQSVTSWSDYVQIYVHVTLSYSTYHYGSLD